MNYTTGQYHYGLKRMLEEIMQWKYFHSIRTGNFLQLYIEEKNIKHGQLANPLIDGQV